MSCRARGGLARHSLTAVTLALAVAWSASPALADDEPGPAVEAEEGSGAAVNSETEDDSSTGDEATEEGDSSAGGLGAPERVEEIVVTADRRSRSLQDYAGSVNALSQEALEQAGVNSVRGLTSATPNVQIGVQEGNTEIFIRGIGTSSNTELADPSAAMHFDGIYIPRPRGVGSMLYDVQRLEISRGPQGTLRGRNATAGAVNVVTNPAVLDEWQSEASLQLGSYSQRLGRAMVNVPIGEDLALRLATYYEARSPFYTNVGPIKTLPGAESADSLSYRATLLWEPMDIVKVNLRHDWTQELGTSFGGSNFAPALNAGLEPSDIDNPRDVVYRGAAGSQAMRHWGVGGEITVDLGDINVAYLGSYRDLDYQQVMPGAEGVYFPGMDLSGLDNQGNTYWHTTSKSVVQELRVFSPDDARFRWNVGGFFFNEEQTVFLGGNGDNLVADDNGNAWAAFEYNHPDVKSDSYAGFADATFDITDFWRATGGIRYTSESKSLNRPGFSRDDFIPRPLS